jgi:hypothetical protein
MVIRPASPATPGEKPSRDAEEVGEKNAVGGPSGPPRQRTGEWESSCRAGAETECLDVRFDAEHGGTRLPIVTRLTAARESVGFKSRRSRCRNCGGVDREEWRHWSCLNPVDSIPAPGIAGIAADVETLQENTSTGGEPCRPAPSPPCRQRRGARISGVDGAPFSRCVAD